MRKSIIFSLAVLAIMSFAIMPVMAGQSCGSVDAKLGNANASKACSAHDTNTKSASAKCSHEGTFETAHISVKGMTCAGCENGLTAALDGTDGVVETHKVSYKENLAVVCFDPAKTNSASLVKLISSKGYDTQVMPAVATTANAVQAGAKAGCDTMSKEECAKACGAKAAAACASKKKDEGAKTDGSL